jgi:ribosomal protein S21
MGASVEAALRRLRTKVQRLGVTNDSKWQLQTSKSFRKNFAMAPKPWGNRPKKVAKKRT